MPDVATHRGSCHCGKVRYEVTADLAQVLACNCTICRKRGALWTYVEPAQFKLLAGADELVDYQFNKKIIHHLFCRTCGVSSFARGQGADGSEGIGINVRCLDDVDPASLETVAFDGRSI
jgi:hypothetical protein